MDLVIAFHQRQGLAVKGDWMPFLIGQGFLGEDCTSSKVGAVGFDAERGRIVQRSKDQGGGDGILKTIEGVNLFRSPGEGGRGAGHIEEGSANGGKVPDELSVEVGKAHKGLEFHPVCWGRPFADSGNFNRVHLHLVVRDYQS